MELHPIEEAAIKCARAVDARGLKIILAHNALDAHQVRNDLAGQAKAFADPNTVFILASDPNAYWRSDYREHESVMAELNAIENLKLLLDLRIAHCNERLQLGRWSEYVTGRVWP